MNWDAIGAIGELLSSIVVLVSLVYIAIQVRETKRLAQRSARLERSAAFSQRVLNTPELASILAKVNAVDGFSPFQKAMQETYGLSPVESELYVRQLATIWRYIETDFLTIGDGDIRTTIRNQLAAPSHRRFIDIRGPYFDPRFMDVVERIKSEIDNEPSPASLEREARGTRP